MVTVHYTGWTTDGKMFDSSVARNAPSSFPLDRVIKGWGEGVQLMSVGEKRRLWIPEALAYKGQAGRPAGMLVFDIELLEFSPAPTTPPPDVAAAPADAKVTPSGLAYKSIKAGTGTEHPKKSSNVTVHYSGWQTNGKLFDSSVLRGQPASFGLGDVIEGWTEGVQLMVVGEKMRFWIPEKLAYKGQAGVPSGMLVFDVSSSPIATRPLPGVTFVADRGDVAQRLDQAVQRHLPGAFGLSRSKIQKLVTSGRISVNGSPARRAAQRLAAGDRVALDAVATPPPRPPAGEALPLDVVYEDDDLLVVNKAAGMVAHPTSRQRTGTVVNALLGRAGDVRHGEWSPRLVQRLDRDTSGLMIVARSAAVHSALQRERADIVKDYLALVWGRPSPRRGVIDTALGRDPLDRRRMMVRDSGAPSETSYEVVAHSTGDARGLSLVRCRLGTGRTHQIRVHLAGRGWPIVGDETYGHAPFRRLASPALDRHARAFPRQALHAWRLRVRLPSTGGLIQIEAPIPDDLAALLAAAGLDRALAASARRA